MMKSSFHYLHLSFGTMPFLNDRSRRNKITGETPAPSFNYARDILHSWSLEKTICVMGRTCRHFGIAKRQASNNY